MYRVCLLHQFWSVRSCLSNTVCSSLVWHVAGADVGGRFATVGGAMTLPPQLENVKYVEGRSFSIFKVATVKMLLALTSLLTG